MIMEWSDRKGCLNFVFCDVEWWTRKRELVDEDQNDGEDTSGHE